MVWSRYEQGQGYSRSEQLAGLSILTNDRQMIGYEPEKAAHKRIDKSAAQQWELALQKNISIN